jgi:hypothetical protein
MRDVVLRFVAWLSGRPAWRRLGIVTELLIVDLLKGIVVMLGLYLFNLVATALRIDQKEIMLGVTFAHVFHIGHALNIFVVLYYSLKHLIHAYGNDHE